MKKSFSETVAAKVIRLHMEGVDSTQGDVHFGAFIEKLSALKAALAETVNLAASDGSPSVDFVVSELSHQSPAMVGVEAISFADDSQQADIVAEKFLNFLNKLRNRTIEVDPNNARLVGHLRRLVSGVGEKFSRIWIDGRGREPIPLDNEIANALNDALPDVRREYGAIKGIVKKYIGVGKQPYFKLIPPAGGVEIKCVFPPTLLNVAAATVERSATIEGELRSYEDELWPFEIRVRGIEIHPFDSDLPTLSSFAGLAATATGELSAADFVRGLRNDW